MGIVLTTNSTVGVISVVPRRRKSAEEKALSLKNSMVQSYNRLSSSVSSVLGAYGGGVRQPGRAPVKGRGAAGPRGSGRGTIKRTPSGAGNMAGRGAGRGTGKRPVRGLPRTNSSRVNTPVVNPKGTPNNNPANVKRKKQKPNKAGNTGAVSRQLYKNTFIH